MSNLMFNVFIFILLCRDKLIFSYLLFKDCIVWTIEAANCHIFRKIIF